MAMSGNAESYRRVARRPETVDAAGSQHKLLFITTFVGKP